MIGDREWYELLFHRYEEYVAARARAAQEPRAFDRWATESVWGEFVRLARLANALPPFALKDWETRNPVPGAQGGGYHSTILARRLIGALVLVNALLGQMKRASRKAHTAVKLYLDDGRIEPGHERALGQGKRFVFLWLKRAAERDGATLLDRRVNSVI